MPLKITLLDSLYSKAIKIRDDYTCQRCFNKFEPGPNPGLHLAHCFSRARQLIRCFEDNAVALCVHCHIWGKEGFPALDKNLPMKYRWFNKRLGAARFKKLKHMNDNPGRYQKPDKQELRDYYRAKIKEMESQRDGFIFGARHGS